MIRQTLRWLLGKSAAVWLPAPPDAAAGMISQERRGKRLLVVDDEPNIVKLIVKWLQPHGYEIDTAANGQEALERLRASRPDLLLTDNVMPVMDGFALIAAIRADPILRDLTVLMVRAKFGDVDSSDVDRISGADFFLTKPFDEESLVSKVAGLTRGSRLASTEGAGKRILVVDDEPNIRRMLRRDLRACGYEVEVASDGQEALEKLAAFRPDLLVTDRTMPGVDGPQLIASVRALPDFKTLPVVLMMARPNMYSDEELAKETAFFRAVAPDCVLTKPFNPEELARIASQLLFPPAS